MNRQLTVFVTEIHVSNTQERTKEDGKEDHEEDPQESEMKSIGRRSAKCAYTKERLRANAQQSR